MSTMSTDPAMDRFFTHSYAYAVFPAVTSGALVVGRKRTGTGRCIRGEDAGGICGHVAGVD